MGQKKKKFEFLLQFLPCILQLLSQGFSNSWGANLFVPCGRPFVWNGMLRILYRLVNSLFGAFCKGVSFVLHKPLQNRKMEQILKFKKEKRSRQHLFKTRVLWKHVAGTGGGVVAPSDRKKRLISEDLSLGEQTSYTIFSLSWLPYLRPLGVALILMLQIIHGIACVVFRQNAVPVLICMQNSTEEARRSSCICLRVSWIVFRKFGECRTLGPKHNNIPTGKLEYSPFCCF